MGELLWHEGVAVWKGIAIPARFLPYCEHPPTGIPRTVVYGCVRSTGKEGCSETSPCGLRFLLHNRGDTVADGGGGGPDASLGFPTGRGERLSRDWHYRRAWVHYGGVGIS